jgi:hypothetical protein
MKTFLISILLSLVFFATKSTAQSLDREFGVRLSDADGIDFIFYKKQSENVYRKFRLSDLSVAGVIDDNPGSQFSANADFSFSKEKRTSLGSGFSFYRGFKYGLNFAVNSTNGRDRFNITPHLGYTVGGMYQLTNRLILSVDATPRIFINTLIDDGDVSGFRFSSTGLKTSNVGISARYAF